MKIHPVVAE